MKLPSKAEVTDAFERCFCQENEHCPGCYQDGPGFGYECRRQLCLEVLAILKTEVRKNGRG